MNANIRCLIAACNRANVKYEILHESNNVVAVETHDGPALFANLTTPMNSQSAARLCEDKDFSYAAMSPLVQMPRTKAFLNPEVHEKYQEYVFYGNIPDITLAIEGAFQFPLIVKRNRGSRGSNVFRVCDHHELNKALATIFNQASKHYDYVALAQAHIDIKKEYRAIFLDGEYVFAYEKDTSSATFQGNLSPAYWDGTKAVLVKNKEIIGQLDKLMQPVFKTFNIPFCGADILLDGGGAMWMIEINSAPDFHFIVSDKGTAVVEELYSRMLDKLTARSAK